MKILLVTQYFWPENFRINDLATALAERGHTVTVLTGFPNYPGGRYFPGYSLLGKYRETFGNIEIIRSPLVPRGNGGAIRLFLNYLSFALVAPLMIPRLAETPDVIFVYEPSPITVGIPALAAKKVTGAPIAFWVQDLWPESLSATGMVSSPCVLSLVRRLVSFIYRHCDLVLAQSRGFLPSIHAAGAEKGRIRYFPNSAEKFYVPLTLEASAPERAEMPQGFVIMFAGNIGAAQDFETILAAAERLRAVRDLHWVVIGDGRMFPWLKGRVEQLGLQDTVHLLGRRPVECMPRYFAAADVLLVTLKRSEIFSLTIPSKLQSYFACAKPVLAGLDGEGARIVEEAGAGLAFPAESPEELTHNALKMYRLPVAAREEMGQNALAYFETNFSRTALNDRLESWLFELTEDTKQ